MISDTIYIGGGSFNSLGFVILVDKKKDGSWTTASIKKKYTVDNWAKKDSLKREVKNELISGFKIVNFTSRYSTSNKHIVLVDPRGWQTEITIDNLCHIILNTTIINGTIQDKLMYSSTKTLCTEAEYNAELALLDNIETIKHVDGIKPSKIIPGSKVKFISGYSKTNKGETNIGIHLGYTHIINTKNNYSYSDGRTISLIIPKTKYHIILIDNKLKVISKAKVIEIISEPDKPTTIDELNDIARTTDLEYNAYINFVCAVHNKETVHIKLLNKPVPSGNDINKSKLYYHYNDDRYYFNGYKWYLTKITILSINNSTILYSEIYSNRDAKPNKTSTYAVLEITVGDKIYETDLSRCI